MTTFRVPRKANAPIGRASSNLAASSLAVLVAVDWWGTLVSTTTGSATGAATTSGTLSATSAQSGSAAGVASASGSIDAVGGSSSGSAAGAATASGLIAAGASGPRASTYTLALALPVRHVSASLPARTLSLSVARRSLSVSIPARTLALSMPRRSLVSSVQSFTKGDTATPVFTLTIDSGTIAQPTSLAAQLYAVGSTTLTTSIAVTPGDCTGWSSASVSVPVAFTSANTPTAGRYNVEIVATYADGTRRWPDNASAVQIEIKAPGAP